MSLRLTIRSPQGGSFSITLDEPEVRVGRASTCAVRLPYPVVSSHHLTIRGRDGDWRLRDVGSTNGTVVDGRAIAAGEEIVVRDGMELTIVDVVIVFDIVRDYVGGITLAESGTLLRQMVSEAALTGTDDLAFLEVLEGDGRGDRFPIPDVASAFRVGSAATSDARIRGLPPTAFEVGRRDDGFEIRPASDVPLSLDGTRVDSERRIRSNQQVAVGDVLLVFVDPLEAYLAELDDGADPPKPDDAPRSPAADELDGEPAAESETPRPSKGLTALEWMLLGFGLVAVVAATAALLVIFGAV